MSSQSSVSRLSMLAASFRHRCAVCVAVALMLAPSFSDSRAFAQETPNPFDSALARETVEGVAAVVGREYFDVSIASRVDEALRERLREGRYAGIESPQSLARALTQDLYEVTADKHLAVSYTPPGDKQTVSTEARERARELRGRRQNFGVEHVEILAGNVGYLNLTAFYRLHEVRDAITAAMQTLRHADALILDMRANAGGSPGTVGLLASYLFDGPGTPLFEVVPRSGDGYGAFQTEPVSGHNGSRPVFVLTSQSTFSAGEGLAFILQERGRAEIVGETTAGAANPGRPYRVNPLFEVVVPNGQVRTALTGRNWEGAGVTPDVAVPASEALRAARVRAIRKLLADTAEGSWADTLRHELKRLEGISVAR